MSVTELGLQSLLASIVVLRRRRIEHADRQDVDLAIDLVFETADHYFEYQTMEEAVLPPGWRDTIDGPVRK